MTNTVTLYHGAHKDFEQFAIGKEYLDKENADLSEGLGIYLTDTFESAKILGNLVYEVEVSENDVIDFTDKQVIVNTFEKMRDDVEEATGCDILAYMDDVWGYADRIARGVFACMTIPNDILDMLGNKEIFHMEFGHLLTYEEDCIYNLIEQSFYKHIKDVLKNTNRSYNVPIYVCHRNPEILKIVEKHVIKKQKIV
ncbi:hypothetical protein U8V72_21055 [Priestia filamentosa]|uniref:hypothetical protein n=1 Tax=Priestia filamentosa TaxID=1402861 RepID=UPI00397C8D72